MYKVYAITDIGNTRQENQDGLFIDGIKVYCQTRREIYYETDAPYIHVSVMDGVGGTQHAKEAVKYALDYLGMLPESINSANASSMLQSLNSYVYQHLIKTGRKEGATTIAGVVMTGSYSLAYNIGDSPVFMINNGFLEKVSIDDTSRELFASIQEEEDIASSKAPLLQSIGNKEKLELTHVRAESKSVCYLLCSDGLTDLVSIDELEDIIEYNPSLQEICRTSVNRARECGGTDNISIAIVINEDPE